MPHLISYRLLYITHLYTLQEMKNIRQGDQYNGMLYSSTVVPASSSVATSLPVPPAHTSQNSYAAHIQSHMNIAAHSNTLNPLTYMTSGESDNPFGHGGSNSSNEMINRPPVPISQAPSVRPQTMYRTSSDDGNNNCNINPEGSIGSNSGIDKKR